MESISFGLSCAILHNIGDTPQRFTYLAQALHAAWECKATGYIITPDNEVINVRKGKRKGTGKHWVPCNASI